MSASPSPTAGKISPPSEDQDTRRALKNRTVREIHYSIRRHSLGPGHVSLRYLRIKWTLCNRDDPQIPQIRKFQLDLDLTLEEKSLGMSRTDDQIRLRP